MKGKRMFWIIAGTVAVIVAIAVYVAIGFFTGPMYKPGMPRPETAAARIDGDYFVMGDGGRLYFQGQGQGEAVLMLHGGPGYPFREPWPALAGLPGHRFIYFDQRGCGKSSRPFVKLTGSNLYEKMRQIEGSLGIAAQLADIDALRRGLGVAKITLIGHSFGAFLAALYAADYPDHVAKLVLVAPAAVMITPGSGDGLYGEIMARLTDDQDRKEFTAWLAQIFDFPSLLDKSETELSELYAAMTPFYGRAMGASREDAAKLLSRDHSIGGFVTPAIFLGLGKTHDFRPGLAKITAPTLIVTGTDDMAGQAAVIRQQYADMIPGARLFVTKSKGHFIFDDNQGEFTKLVAGFL